MTDEVEIIAKETAFQGFYRIDRYRLRHRRHDGGWTGEMVREVLERGQAVAVLPYDPDRDEVVLIEQFRIGAYAAGRAPWLTEIVAGTVEPGEVPEEVAHREAMEEAGLKLEELLPVADVLLSQGAMSETVKVFCGRVRAERAGGVHGLDEEHEDIKVTAVPFAEAAALVREGRLSNALILLALQWLMLNRDDLRRRWRPSGEAPHGR